MTRRLITAICGAALIATMAASAAFAGEITGNGKSLHIEGDGLHGRSACAFSGQEDLQFLDEQGNPLPVPHKGVPGHAQSWGQIPKTSDDPTVLTRDFLTSIGSNPGIACNPTKGAVEP
jgi:hypothetical protein